MQELAVPALMQNPAASDGCARAGCKPPYQNFSEKEYGAINMLKERIKMGVKPTPYMCNAILHGHSKEVHSIYLLMREYNLIPKSGAVDNIIRSLMKMKDVPLEPSIPTEIVNKQENELTSAHALALASDGKIQEALDFFEKV